MQRQQCVAAANGEASVRRYGRSSSAGRRLLYLPRPDLPAQDPRHATWPPGSSTSTFEIPDCESGGVGPFDHCNPAVSPVVTAGLRKEATLKCRTPRLGAGAVGGPVRKMLVCPERDGAAPDRPRHRHGTVPGSVARLGPGDSRRVGGVGSPCCRRRRLGRSRARGRPTGRSPTRQPVARRYVVSFRRLARRRSWRRARVARTDRTSRASPHALQVICAVVTHPQLRCSMSSGSLPSP